MNMRSEILVAIWDSDRVASHSIQLLINNNFKAQVGAFYAAEDFYKKLQLKPDIVIVEFNLPDATGFDVLHKIQTVSPSTKVIFMSNQLDTVVIKKLMNSSIHDYIVKSERALNNLQLSLEIIYNEKRSMQNFMKETFGNRNEILSKFKGSVNKFFGGNELDEFGKEIDDIKLKHPDRKF